MSKFLHRLAGRAHSHDTPRVKQQLNTTANVCTHAGRAYGCNSPHCCCRRASAIGHSTTSTAAAPAATPHLGTLSSSRRKLAKSACAAALSSLLAGATACA
eukprot:scaffold14082_cov21-Tisochrysis_lutea.AAC.1